MLERLKQERSDQSGCYLVCDTIPIFEDWFGWIDLDEPPRVPAHRQKQPGTGQGVLTKQRARPLSHRALPRLEPQKHRSHRSRDSRNRECHAQEASLLKNAIARTDRLRTIRRQAGGTLKKFPVQPLSGTLNPTLVVLEVVPFKKITVIGGQQPDPIAGV